MEKSSHNIWQVMDNANYAFNHVRPCVYSGVLPLVYTESTGQSVAKWHSIRFIIVHKTEIKSTIKVFNDFLMQCFVFLRNNCVVLTLSV